MLMFVSPEMQLNHFPQEQLEEHEEVRRGPQLCILHAGLNLPPPRYHHAMLVASV